MDTSIQLNKDKDIVYSSFTLHKNGLTAIGTPTFEQWEEVGEFIKKSNGAVHFWIGDWCNFGEHNYGETYSQALDATHFDYGTLRNDKHVASKVELSRRRDNLSYSHHVEVAELEPDEQEKLLDLAEKKEIKSKDFRKVVQEYKRKKEQALLPPIDKKRFSNKVIKGDCVAEMQKLPDKSIDMIYVDPPYGVDKAEWDTFKEGEFLTFTTSWIKECIRLLKPQSHFFIHFPSQKSAWLEDLILQEFNMMPISRIVWCYRNLIQGRDATIHFLSTYQPILHYNFGNKELNFPTEWNDERFDVWNIAAPQTNFGEGKDHITQKPLELMERLVRFGSFEGEVVLDPMAGSGTTGVAALKNNRDFILIEREEEYIDVIHRRLNELGK